MRTGYKRILNGVVLALPMALLVGCGGPTEFGVPQKQWDQMNQQQRQSAIAQYNQQKSQDAKEETFWNLLGAAGSMVHTDKTLSSSSSTNCSGDSCTTDSSSSSFSIN